jgi:hypothetical protein
MNHRLRRYPGKETHLKKVREGEDSVYKLCVKFPVYRDAGAFDRKIKEEMERCERRIHRIFRGESPDEPSDSVSRAAECYICGKNLLFAVAHICMKR